MPADDGASANHKTSHSVMMRSPFLRSASRVERVAVDDKSEEVHFVRGYN